MALTLNRVCGFEAGTNGSSNLGELENATALTLNSALAPSGEYCIALNSSSSRMDVSVINERADAGNYWIVGFHVRFTGTIATNYKFFEITDPSNNTWFAGLWLAPTTKYWQASGGQAGISSSAASWAPVADTDYYVEMYFNPHSTNSDMKVWVDGTLIIDVTGFNCTSGVGGSPVSMRWFGDTTTDISVDDVYCLTDAATTDKWGKIHVIPYQTAQTGSTSAAGDNLGAGNWQACNESIADTPTQAAFTASNSGGSVDMDRNSTWAINGGSTRGPLNDSTYGSLTVKALHVWGDCSRSGGGGSAHYWLVGNDTDGTVQSQDLNPTTSAVNYTFCTTNATYLPTSTEYLRAGFQTTGGQDFECNGFLAHVVYEADTANPRDVVQDPEQAGDKSTITLTSNAATVTKASPRNVVCTTEVITLTENQGDTGIDRTIDTVAASEQIEFSSSATVVRDPDVRKVTGQSSKAKRWKALPWSEWIVDGHTGIYSVHDAGTINNMLDGDLGTSYNVTSESVPWIQGTETLTPESSTTAVPVAMKVRLYVSGTASSTMNMYAGWDYGNQRPEATALERYELEFLGNAEVTGGGGGNWSDWIDFNLAYNNWDDGGATDVTSPLTWNAIQEKFVFYSLNDTGTIACHAIQIMVQEAEPANLISGYVDASLGWKDEFGTWRDQANSWDGNATTFAGTAKGTSTTWADGYFQAAGNTLTQGGAEDEVHSVWMRARLRGQYDATNTELSAILYPFHPNYYDDAGSSTKFPFYETSAPNHYTNQAFAGPDDTVNEGLWEFPATSNTAFWSPWYKLDFNSIPADDDARKWKTWAEIEKMGFRLYRGNEPDGATLELGKVEYVVLAEPPNANRGGGKVKKDRGVNCSPAVNELDGTNHPATVTTNVPRNVVCTTEALALDGTTFPATVTRDRVAAQATPEVLLLTENDAAVSFATPRLVTGTPAVSLLTMPAGNNVNRTRGTIAVPEVITATENASAVARNRVTSSAPEVVTLTESASTVNRTRGASAAPEVVALTENASAINRTRVAVGASEVVTLDSSGGEVAFGRLVAAATESLALSTNNAVVNRSRGTAAATEVTDLVTSSASVAANRGVISAVESLTLTENPADVTKLRAVIGTPEVLTLTENAATVDTSSGSVPRDVTCTTEVLALSAQNAGVNGGRNVGASPEAVALATNAASLNRTRGTAATSESVLITSNNADVEANRGVIGSTEEITLTENAAIVSTTADRIVTGLTEQISLIESAANLNMTRGVESAVEALQLSSGPASIVKLRNVLSSTESIALAVLPSGINASRVVSGITEVLASTSPAATVFRGANRIVTGATAAIVVDEAQANITFGRLIVCSTSDQLLTTLDSLVNRSRQVEGITETIQVATGGGSITKTRTGAQPGSLIWAHPGVEEYVLVDGRMIQL